MMVNDKTFQIVLGFVTHNIPSYEYHLPGRAKSGNKSNGKIYNREIPNEKD